MSNVSLTPERQHELRGAVAPPGSEAQAVEASLDLHIPQAMEELQIHVAGAESAITPEEGASDPKDHDCARPVSTSTKDALASEKDNCEEHACTSGEGGPEVEGRAAVECARTSTENVTCSETLVRTDGKEESDGRCCSCDSPTDSKPALQALQPVMDAIRDGKNFLVAEQYLAEVTLRLLREPDCMSHADVTQLIAWASGDAPEGTVPSFTTEVLRCLRNAVGVNTELRVRASSEPRLIHYLLMFLLLRSKVQRTGDSAVLARSLRPCEALTRLSVPNMVLASRAALQVLGNIATTEVHCRATIWSGCRELLLPLLRCDDMKLAHLVPMLLFQLLREEEHAVDLINTAEFAPILQLLLEMVADVENEWALLCLQSLTAVGGLHRVSPLVQSPQRPLFVDMVLDGVERRTLYVHGQDLIVVREWVKALCHPLTTLRPDSRPQTCAFRLAETKKMLQLLAVLTSDDRFPSAIVDACVRQYAPLVDTVVRALVAVHRAGGMFGSITKLSQLATAGGKEVVEGPAHGLKSLLVRLLGNLVHKCASAQLRARPAIPYLLECCNVDATNPLLQQWAIVAIRNLCAGRPENQALIAELTLQGVSPEAQQELAQLGVSAVQQAGAVRVGGVPPPPPPPPEQ